MNHLLLQAFRISQCGHHQSFSGKQSTLIGLNNNRLQPMIVFFYRLVYYLFYDYLIYSVVYKTIPLQEPKVM